MMQWPIRNPARFLEEREKLDLLHKDKDWLVAVVWRVSSKFVIEVDIDLVIHGETYPLTLTYPDLYPDTPAYIFPRDQVQYLSVHQYGPGGSLCLEWRADNWDTNITAVDLIESAYRLLSTEKHPTQPKRVNSVHHITQGQKLRGTIYRLICTTEFLSLVAEIPDMEYRRLQNCTLLHSNSSVTYISSITYITKLETENNLIEDIADIPAGITSPFPLFAYSREGTVLRSRFFNKELTISSFEELMEILSQAGFSAKDILLSESDSNKLKDQTLLMLGDDLVAIYAFQISAGEETSIQQYNIIMPENDNQRLPIEYSELSEVRFGIVGMGSIGSKIAVSLARSGARKFLLVDDDFLTPENICRNELSWSSVGMHKTDAVHEELSRIAAGIEVLVRSHRIAGQESAMAADATLKALSCCDILIDATANSSAFIQLAAIAKIYKIPLCWGEVFTGGIGGLIARARPDIDPNPNAVRTAILNYLGTLPEAPYKVSTGYDIDEQEPLVAYDSDVTHIASALIRLILDTALNRNPSIFPFSAYLIGLRREWIFEQPFDTYPIEVTGDGWEKDVDLLPREQQLHALKTLLEIAAEGQNADAHSSN